jgi:hypothetical protein
MTRVGKRRQKLSAQDRRSHGLCGVGFVPLVEYPFLADVAMTL